MKKKSKNILAILMAVAMMSSLCSVPAAAAETEAGGIVSETSVVEDAEIQETETEEPEATEAEDFSAEDEISVEEDDEITAEDEETDELAVENEDEAEAVGDEEEFTDDAAGDGVVDGYGWLGSTWITPENAADILKNGTASYDADTQKLTLNNAKVDGTIDFRISGDVTLELKGQNEIIGEFNTGTDYLIDFWGDKLTITGKGSLIASDMGKSFINDKGDLVIDGVSLEFTSKREANNFYGIKVAGNLEIKNGANVTLNTSAESIYAYNRTAVYSVRAAEQTPKGKIIISDSKIKLTSAKYAIFSYKDITIQNSTLEAEGSIYNYLYEDAVGATLDIDNSKVEVTDDYFAFQVDTLKIRNKSAVTATLTDENAVTAILSYKGIDINDSKVISGGSQYGLATQEGDITIENNAVVTTTGTTSGIQTDKGKIYIRNKSNVTVNMFRGKYSPYGALKTQSGIDITDSKVTATGTGYSIDSYGDVNIDKGIVIADATMDDGSGLISIIAYGEENEGPKNVNITNSWVDAVALIDGTVTVKDSVVFEKNDGKVTGNAVIPGNVEVRKAHKLTVSEPATLTAPSGSAIANNGIINAYCTSVRGTVTGTAPVYTHANTTKWIYDKTSHWKACSRCGEKMAAAEAHRYGSWKTLKAAGLGTSGAKERHCTVCGHTQGEDIAAVQVMQLLAKGGKKSVTLKWNKVSGADGYMIYSAKCGRKLKLKKTVGNNVRTWKQKKLKAGTYYKYYVEAYKLVNGKKVVIGESSDIHTATNGKRYGYAKKITVKKSTFKLSVGKTATIKATLKNTSKKVKDHTVRIRYISTNNDVATVNAKGKITAKSAGTCYIYCYALNGLTKKVKVTVQ